MQKMRIFFNRRIALMSMTLGAALLLLPVLPALAQGGAESIAYNSSVTGALDATASVVSYSITGAAGDQIAATVIGLAAGMKPDLELTGPAGTPPVQGSADPLQPASGGAALYAVLPVEGAYTLTVSAGKGTLGSFVLTLTGGPAPEASLLADDQPTEVTITSDSEPPTMRFDLTPDGPTTLTLSSLTARFAYAAEVRDGQGQPVARLGGGVQTATVTLAPGDSTYTLTVGGATPEQAGIVSVLVTRGAAAATPTVAVTPATPTVSDGDCTAAALYLADVTVPDGTLIEPGTEFVKTWRIQNSGTCTWGEGYTFTQIDGTLITPTRADLPLPELAPGESFDYSVVLSLGLNAPLGEPTGATFEMRHPSGYVFGPLLSVQIIPGVPEQSSAAQTGDCINQAVFNADVTIPDGSSVAPGQPFVKTWRIMNTGTCAWDETYTLVQIIGDLLVADPASVPLDVTAPNATADVSASLTLAVTAPAGQSQRAVFRLRTLDGQYFGDELYVEVVPQ